MCERGDIDQSLENFSAQNCNFIVFYDRNPPIFAWPQVSALRLFLKIKSKNKNQTNLELYFVSMGKCSIKREDVGGKIITNRSKY